MSPGRSYYVALNESNFRYAGVYGEVCDFCGAPRKEIITTANMPKAFRVKIAKFIRKTANNLVKEGDNYTTGRFTARMME